MKVKSITGSDKHPELSHCPITFFFAEGTVEVVDNVLVFKDLEEESSSAILSEEDRLERTEALRKKILSALSPIVDSWEEFQSDGFAEGARVISREGNKIFAASGSRFFRDLTVTVEE